MKKKQGSKINVLLIYFPRDDYLYDTGLGQSSDNKMAVSCGNLNN